MSKCQRPGCTGTMEDVGAGELYCDVCGRAPVRQPVGTGVSGGAGASSVSRGLRGHNFASSSALSRSSRRSASGGPSRTFTGTFGGLSVTVRGSRSGDSGPTRHRLGAGLVSIPAIPRPDPATSVMKNPEVPEGKRYCGKSDCGAPVSRGGGGRPARTEGFCAKCGHPYSFTPKLRAGDVLQGQYEVVGCLAHGGFGWIYLAVDRAVSDRWVVLKGLLDSGDEDALAAALAERRFLAEIEHPNIVRIHNFVEHLDPRTGSLDGYIVMAYVGGKSLKEIAEERRGPDGKREPLPVEQAIAYAIEALDALGHLHSRDLLYCDFKIDNAIQTGDRLELIDMGAVRRMDDEDSAIYGTLGYQAPEVAEFGPSVASDLYTVARALAVLTFDFQGFTNVFADSLPGPENIPVFARYESFYRLLVRATDPDPDKRFGSAAEMADQLLGVLREIVALQTGEPRPALSTIFGQELRVVEDKLVAPLTGDTSALGAFTFAARRGAGRRSANGGVGALSGRTAGAAAASGAGPAAEAAVSGLRPVAEPSASGPGPAAGGAQGGAGAGHAPSASGTPYTVPAQGSGPGSEVGAGPGAGAGAGLGTGARAGTGLGAGGGGGAGPWPGLGARAGVGTGTEAGTGAGVGGGGGPWTGLGATAGAKPGTGTGAGAGGGAGAGTGVGGGAGPWTGLGATAGAKPGTGTGAGAGTGVGTGAGIGVGTGTGAGTGAGTGGGTGGGSGGGSGVALAVARLDARAAALALPVPFVAPSDPNAGFLAGLAAAAPAELVTALRTAPVDSVEIRLRELRARLDMDDVDAASHVLAALADDDRDDWRVVWHRGLTALTTGDHETAAPAFDAVYHAFPGESAPKLALGICAEMLGRPADAAEYYRLVWTTDQRYVSAAFGLARVLLASGDRAGAVAALESVPAASIHFTAARVAAIRSRLRERSPREPLLDDLRAAAAQVEELRQLDIDTERREQLTTEVLGSALDWLLSGSPGAGPEATGTRLLDCDLTERGLRFGMERSFRVLARLAQQDSSGTELVERANRFRPWTWV
ncbi:tetratricopeptide repeat protein [Streptomyces sp. NBC_00827]|uniref:serine/threonine-protein kinase n=1 Tax=Streptomyces sp. NBC_00827 TaxID=2903677 RepID=UPI00386BD07A|nr:serine/threonine-protein kinase PknG [Streptomyces sp. NBC_00827]